MDKRAYRYNLLAEFDPEDVDRFLIDGHKRRNRHGTSIWTLCNVLETVVMEPSYTYGYKEAARSTEDIPAVLVTLRSRDGMTPAFVRDNDGQIKVIRGAEASYVGLDLPSEVGITVPRSLTVRSQEALTLPTLHLHLGQTAVPPQLPL